MIQCVINRDTLHQYIAAVPHGKKLEACLADPVLYKKLLAEPTVMILGRFGELLGLNLMAGYMTEQLIAGRSSEEILRTMVRRFASDRETATRIMTDYFDLIRLLDQKGYARIFHTIHQAP